MNKLPITEKHFNELIHAGNWEINELSLHEIKRIPRVVRPTDILGGFSSGSFNQPKTMNKQSAVAGIDVICHEPNPRASEGEGFVNVYHYIIKKTAHQTHPFLIIGPFRDETLMGHWPQDLELNSYE